MNLVPLHTLCSRVATWNPLATAPGEAFNYIDIASIDRDRKQITAAMQYVGSNAPSRARQIVEAGDVLVSTVRPNLNAVAIVPPSLAGATASTGFTVLRTDPKKLNAEYLFQWVKHPRFVAEMTSLATGASYPAITDGIVKSSCIPLPTLPEQKCIAAILDEVDALRHKRREAITHLDRLLQSVFLEMFGDPVTNPKCWLRRTISDFGNVVTGNTPSREQSRFYGGDLEWIKSDNINTPFHFLTTAEEHLSDAGRKVARVVPAGSILVSCIAGSPDCIGNAAIADREVAFNQQINAITPYERTDTFFLYAQLLVAKRLVQNTSTNSMKGMVNKSAFSAIELICPDQTLRQSFANIFTQIDNQSTVNRDALAKSEDLFSSFQHEAFSNRAINTEQTHSLHNPSCLTLPF